MTKEIETKMTIHEARMIRELRRGHTWRALAHVYYPKGHPGHGNQLYGNDLTREAAKILGMSPQDLDEGKGSKGEFSWWEYE